MPRVDKINTKKWKELFRYNRENIRFDFNKKKKGNRSHQHAFLASDLVPKINQFLTNAQKPKEQQETIKWEAWHTQFAFSFSAALCSTARPRVKQGAVTTAMEVIDFYCYALKSTSDTHFLDLSKRKQKDFIKIATDRIGRLAYCYFTAYTASSLFEASDWDEASQIHTDAVQKLGTDQFYLIKHHAAKLIEDICPSPPDAPWLYADYDPSSHRLIPDRERANIRKRIARLIDNIPVERLAYEAAYFSVENCAHDVIKKFDLKTTRYTFVNGLYVEILPPKKQ
ncbi:hypothetical protein SYK_32150 [Pseudodesulfovibrio nedwellii]|uniref:Uncharacterized protein n=1 Tax=Pseudodesulfovibrio nedwellii TaxID=2973072 RepID=A0ABM8B530_9BACT|nr:hypothetical protein [Pseudodesulfovibrio nedwellii]BDQ38855.1 hypothetical protein SYK_32150 [Pseudodesulfovibrio nedwellii]